MICIGNALIIDVEMDVQNYFMDICPDLIVRTDHGFSSDPDYKNIAKASCKAEQDGRHCPNRGACIEAKVSATGRRVNSKSFQR